MSANSKGESPRTPVSVDGERKGPSVSPGTLLRSVNRHLRKVKQFVEMDYDHFGRNAKYAEDHDFENIGTPTTDEETSSMNKITEVNIPSMSVGEKELNTVNSEISPKVEDSEKRCHTEVVIGCASRESGKGDSAINDISNLKYGTESLETLNATAVTNKAGDSFDTDSQHSDSGEKFPPKDSAGVKAANESTETASNVTGEYVEDIYSENNKILDGIRKFNEIKNNEKKDEDEVDIKETPRNTVNMQDLKEISHKLVNGIIDSIQERMIESGSDKISDVFARTHPDRTFRTKPDTTISNENTLYSIKVRDVEAVKECCNTSIEKVSDDFFESETSKRKDVSTSLISKTVEPLIKQICESSLVLQSGQMCVSLTEDISINRDSDLTEKPDFDEDTICGIWKFRPDWLQEWATPRTYLVIYSLIGIIQGTFYSFLIPSISTLEKRFAFKSKVSGAIMVVDEITPLFLGILIGYLGGLSHRPRILALGMLMSVAACFLMVLPYIIYGPAKHLDILPGQNNTGVQLCNLQEMKDLCDSDDRPPTIAAVMMFLFACFLKGFGSLAYYSVGLSYMDDHTKKKNTAVYLAIAFALRLFGPTLGFLMSSVFLKMNENPFEDPGYGPDDPRWIGCWWMGFMIHGILLFFFTVPIAMFPRRLPKQASIPNTLYNNDQTWLQKFAGLIPALKRLSRNPLFMFLCFNTIMSILGNFGHFVMLPKYMEYQFRLTASEASRYSGPPSLVTMQVVTVIGGFLIWKFRPTAKFLIAGLALCEVFNFIGFLVLMIPKCEKIELSNIGFTVDGSLNLENKCNAGCMCTTATFTPLCGPDGRTSYFSPCHAGCTESQKIGMDKEIYNNCSCVTDELGRSTLANHLKKGFCVEESCWSQALAYIILLPVFTGLSTILNVSHTMVLLRSIAPEDKSVALGAFETLICLFGFIPYPILFGALVDSACIVWEQSCGKTGNCWFYDMDKFNYMLHSVSATFSILSALSMVVIYFFSSRLKDLYEDEVLKENDADSEKKQACDDATTNC